jgi:hypothetical protein
MVKKFAPLFFGLIIGLSLVRAASAATIDFATISSTDAIYSFSIIADTEYPSLILPGDTVDLSGLGDLYTGTYYVSSVDHSFGSEGYTSYFTLERQEGAIVDDEGNTDISLTLLNYEFATFNFLQGGFLLIGFEFVESVPEPSTLLLLALGMIGLMVFHQRQVTIQA